jgi:hypothetical protein
MPHRSIPECMVTDPYGAITITKSPFRANGTYMMHVEVIGVDNPRNIFTLKTVPKIDFIFTNESSNSEGKTLIVPEFSSSLVSLIIVAGLAGIVIMTVKVRA